MPDLVPLTPEQAAEIARLESQYGSLSAPVQYDDGVVAVFGAIAQPDGKTVLEWAVRPDGHSVISETMI